MKSRIIIIFCIALLALSQSCNKNNNANQINFAAFQLYTSGLVVAADKIDSGKSCYDEKNLEVNIIKRSKGPDVVDALIGGSGDFGTLANTPVVLQAMQNKDLVIFATIMTTDHDIKVVGHKKFGVNSGQDLIGKKIGYVGGTIGEIFLDRYLYKYGIDKDNVTPLSAGPAQLRDYFIEDELDAIIIWEPTIQDILRDTTITESDIFIDVDTTLYNMRMHLVATPEKLKKHRNGAIKLVESLICAEKKIVENPTLIRKHLELWLDREEDTLINVFEPSPFKLILDKTNILKELYEEAEWAKESIFKGNITIPDLSENIDYSILEEIAPERIIH